MKWIQVRNETNGQVLLERVRRCSSFVCRLRGLMFRPHLGDGEGLLLIGQRKSRLDPVIHMLFVFFPIAVVWLDADGRVADATLARPFRPLYVPGIPARDVLEGPPSLLDQVNVGDQIGFREVRGE